MHRLVPLPNQHASASLHPFWLNGFPLHYRGDQGGNGPGATPPRGRVLLVEDDLMIGQMYLLGLRAAGYEVTLATDGLQAMERIRSGRPDLVLLDIRIPNMDGLEVLAAVKEDDDLRSIPIVVLSNFGEQQTVDQARSLGAIEYLNKSSVTPGELARRLSDWLGESA